MRKIMLVGLIFLQIFFFRYVFAQVNVRPAMPDLVDGISVGITAEKLFDRFPKEQCRTYRMDSGDEWITYDYKANEELDEMVTFQLKDNVLVGWKLNDREEAVREYLSEFVPINWPEILPVMYRAVKNVLERVPDEVFYAVTDRRKPVVFTEYHSAGPARFANTSQVSSLPEDPPAFSHGVVILKLNSDLNASADIKAVEGVIFHELAHVFLGHLSGSTESSPEKAANDLVKEWGFAKEYEKAKSQFGRDALHPDPGATP